MLIPPSLLYVRVSRGGRRGILLPVPLVLLWPLVAAAEIILAPVGLVAGAVLALRGDSRARAAAALAPRAVELFASLRGLDVDVRDGPDRIRLLFL